MAALFPDNIRIYEQPCHGPAPDYKSLLPLDQQLIWLLKRDLDEGEAEVIALALEQKAHIVLINESNARKVVEV